MTAYADVDNIKSTINVPGTTLLDADIEAAIAEASSAIDAEFGRRFDLSDTGVTRLYTPQDSVTLPIDDLVDLDTFKVDRDGDGTFEETWTINTDFVLLPLNAPLDDEPYTHIEVRPQGRYAMPVGQRGSVQIVGQWGWPEIPDRIVGLASLVATQLIHRKRDSPMGVMSFSSGDAVAAVHIAMRDPHMAALAKGLSRRSPLISSQLG